MTLVPASAAGVSGSVPLMAARYRIRCATARDVAVLVRHRVEMFRSMGILPAREEPVMAAAFRRHLRRAIPDGRYLGWVAEHRGAVVAGAGVVPRPLLPRPGAPKGGLEAYVLNVFTEEAHRGRGLAKRLMREIVRWSRRKGAVQASLHASDMGRGVYEAVGFKPRPREMRLKL